MKDKIIEEMARSMCKSNLSELYAKCDDCFAKKNCGFWAVSKDLINAGYRKIPENAVVLTNEEYKKWLEFVISYLILFVCEHRRGLGEDPLWQPNEDEREKIPLDLDNMFKKITEGKDGT